MLKKSLLLMLLMALLAPWAAKGQTLTVYDNDDSNVYVPTYGYYADNYSKCEFVMAADAEGNSLAAMNGKSITKMKFYISAVGTYGSGWTSGTFQVFMKEIASTTIDAYQGTEDATIVYEGSFANPAVGEYEITFTNEYTYNGGNLLIGVYRTVKGGYKDATFKGKTVNGASLSNYSSSLSGVSATQRNFLPKTTFTYETPATCTKPTNLAATLTPGDGTIATMSWTENGTATNWVLEYGTDPEFTSVKTKNVSGTPSTNLTGLTAEAKHYARVKADCGGGDESGWSTTCEFTPTNELFIKILGETSLTSNYLPSHTNYDYAYTQQIYTAAEMGGFDCTLQSVAFKGNKAAVCTLDIYLANTTKSSFSSTTDYIDISEATLVFTGQVTFTADDWTTINFDEEFEYTGGNIAVIVDDNSNNYDYGSTTWQTFSATGQALYFYQDDTNINPTAPSVSSSYNSGISSSKDQIKFRYELPSPYQKPQNLQVSNLTGTSATITWEAPNTDVVGYKYQYQPQGGDWTTLTSTTALSAPLPGLTSNTTYTFQVQAIFAGDNESGFASTTFTTLIDIPYVYGFEDAAEFTKWEIVDCEVNGYYNVADNEYSRTGNGCFMFSSYSGSTDPQYLISPQLSGIANGLHVSFYYRSLQDNDPETFMVGYSTTDKDPDSFIWSDEVTCPDGSYYPYAVNFMVPEIKYVAVKYTTADKYYLFVDDFTFEEAPNCLEPTGVDAINITTTTADITWTNGGDEEEWDIYATDDINDVPDGTTTPTVEGVTTKPHQLTLLPGTTYYVYVRAACSAKEHSAWSSPHSFHTDCEGMDLPYGPYGFEDGALTVCWNLLSTNVAYNTVSMNTTASYIHTGDYSLLMHSGSDNGDFVLALPVIDGSYPLSDYRFVFWAMASNTAVKVTIGIMEDPNDMTTFVAQSEEFNPASEYAEYKVPFNGYSGDGHYVAIKVSRASGSNWGNVYFDDIAIELLPSCIEPSGLTVSDEAPHGATFSWTDGGSEEEWHLYFSKENTAPADDIDLKEVTVADSNPFILTTGLDPETDYYVWVRANCGSTDGYSTWVGPETFTTDVACPAPTGLAASEITGHTAKLSWNGTSESYILSVGTYDYTATPVVGTIVDEDFESGMPTGWTHIGNGSAGVEQPTATHTHNGKALKFSGATSNNVVVLPQFAAETNELSISFYSKAEGSNSGAFDLGYVTDPTDASTFVRIGDEYTAAQHSSYTHVENVSMASAPGGARIAFRHRSGQTYWFWFIDDVVISGPTYPIAWTDYDITTTSKTVDGLDPETPYFAKVKGYCGSDDGYSQETAVISFTTDIACPAPSALTPSNPTSVSFDLSWNNGGASDWIVAYKKTTETYFTEISLNISDVTEEAGVISYTLGGLDDDTEYTVKVRDNCEPSYTGDGVSDWTAEVTYSTIPACSALNPVVSNITHHTAKVDWDGESTSGYTVKYRESALVSTENPVFYEAFNTNSSTPPTDWTRYSGLVDAVIAGSTSLTTVTTGWSTNNTYALGSYNAKLNIYGINVKHWLVTPEVVLTNGLSLSFDLALTDYGNGNVIEYPEQQPDDRFVVLVFADDAWHILREWNNSGSPYVYNTIATTGENVVLDLAAYAGKTIKVAFYGESTVSGASSGVDDNDLHIDNVLIGTTIPAGDWQTQAAATTTANLSGLTAGTMYDVKIVPNCDPTQESIIANFTTLSSDKKYFLTAGDWGTASNWMDNEIPVETDNVIIRANVNVEPGCVAMANNITFEGATTPTITIADGGQLNHANTITATLEKNITGYGDPNNPGGWYLIATPQSSTYITTNFSGTFDLYKYNEPDYMWYTYNTSVSGQSFNYLYRNTGYLYAHDEDTKLNFTGETMGTETTTSKSLSYTASLSPAHADVIGFNLIGNPFTRNLVDGDMTIGGGPLTSYYVINPDGDALVQVNSDSYQIKPGEGFFVQAGEPGQSVVFNPSSKDAFNVAYIKIVAGNEDGYDNACIQIEEGNTLRKMNIAKKTSVYVIDNGDDYAAATIHELAGTMPVHFNAIADGEFTITVNAKNIEPSTMMLYDNQTGELIDLLETPSYSFKASAEDEDNRFKLIFDFNNNYNGVDDNYVNGNFAYQNGDELFISGDGTLQVFDVMGRFVMSKEIHGSESVSVSAFETGVYMLRLVGENVMTQKIVIRK